jgi:prepilin-type N-terminal cleavage/methylation domain-containing protein
MNKKSTISNQGFTLIELLIVIAIMSVLIIVTLTALKPAQRLSDSRDVRRAQDISEILTAIHECAIDKKDNASMSTCLGSYVTNNTYEIVSGTGITSGCQTACSSATSDSSCLRLDSTLGDYFIDLPKDPTISTTGHTGYSLKVYTNGMTVIESCKAENGAIKVSR